MADEFVQVPFYHTAGFSGSTTTAKKRLASVVVELGEHCRRLSRSTPFMAGVTCGCGLCFQSSSLHFYWYLFRYD